MKGIFRNTFRKNNGKRYLVCFSCEKTGYFKGNCRRLPKDRTPNSKWLFQRLMSQKRKYYQTQQRWAFRRWLWEPFRLSPKLQRHFRNRGDNNYLRSNNHFRRLRRLNIFERGWLRTIQWKKSVKKQWGKNANIKKESDSKRRKSTVDGKNHWYVYSKGVGKKKVKLGNIYLNWVYSLRTNERWTFGISWREAAVRPEWQEIARSGSPIRRYFLLISVFSRMHFTPNWGSPDWKELVYYKSKY